MNLEDILLSRPPPGQEGAMLMWQESACNTHFCVWTASKSKSTVYQVGPESANIFRQTFLPSSEASVSNGYTISFLSSSKGTRSKRGWPSIASDIQFPSSGTSGTPIHRAHNECSEIGTQIEKHHQYNNPTRWLADSAWKHGADKFDGLCIFYIITDERSPSGQSGTDRLVSVRDSWAAMRLEGTPQSRTARF